MNTGFGFYIFISGLVIDICELLRRVKRIIRIKIIIWKLDVLIVKLGIFGEYIIDGGAAITYELFIRDEIFYNGYDFLNLWILDDFRTLSFFHYIHGLAQDFELFFIVGCMVVVVVAAIAAMVLVLARHLNTFIMNNE